MEVETMKKCNLSTVIACLLFFVLFLVSQMRISSISNKLIATISTCMDEGTTFSVFLDPQSQEHAHSDSAGPIICNRSHRSYDICSINGPTILDPKVSTFYAIGHTSSTTQVEKVKPYPRKWDIFRMSQITEVTLASGPPRAPCMVQHNAPALLFSAGGYSGDFFTDFSDEFIPLFITINSIYSSEDLVLVISNAHDWWTRRYADLLQTFSKYPIINLDNDTTTHCFPSVTIGLISLDLMSADVKPRPNSKTISHFHALLDKTYAHNHPSNPTSLKSRPQMVLAGRNSAIGRVIMNQAKVKKVAEEEGFDVIEFEPKYATPLREAYALVSSSHVMVGVHGAALTHFLFLQPGSVFMQVVPIGTEQLAEVCFGNLARDMGLKYMEYKIGVEESSLVDEYGKDAMVLRDAEAFLKKKGGWSSGTVETYLKKQNVRLNLTRFRGYLKKAFVKAKAFMDKEG